MRHLILTGPEVAAIEQHIRDCTAEQDAVLLVRPDLKGEDFTRRGIHITIWEPMRHSECITLSAEEAAQQRLERQAEAERMRHEALVMRPSPRYWRQ